MSTRRKERTGKNVADPTEPIDELDAELRRAAFIDDEERSSLMFEIDGAEPDTIGSPIEVLELSASYFDLIRAIAKSRAYDLGFGGLRIVNKCTAVCIETMSPQVTKVIAHNAAQILTGGLPVPKGYKGRVERFHKTFEAMPEQYSIGVRLADWTCWIKSPATMPALSHWQTLAVRATAWRKGGKDETRIRMRFNSEFESEDFTLDTTKDQANAIPLWLPIDIVAIVQRNDRGHIVDGQLQEFHEISSEPPLDAWQRWFASADVAGAARDDNQQRKADEP